MVLLLISFVFLCLSAGAAYLTYYYLNIKDNPGFVPSICFAAITLILFAIFMILVFKFINKKNDSRIKNMEIRLKKWTDISYHATQAGDEAFNKLPIGIVLYDEQFRINWGNEYAKAMFNSNLDDVAIETLSSDLVSKLLLDKEQLDFNYNDHSYDVIHNVKNSILYFFDVTERENIKSRYNARITAIGIIEIDNLEESLKRFDMQEKSNIRGQILGEVQDWLAANNCYLQTLSNDRMVVMMDKESLNKMIDEKFSILGKIRDISQNNRLKASISMGVACFDVEYDELGLIAQTAIELAQKRGGDQVVVKVQGEKIQFFGGNTNSLEKNTLVEARMQAMSIKEAVEGSTNVVIMCHNFADCDAIGSMLGVYHMVSSTGAEVKMAFDPNRADVTVKKIYEQIKADAVISSYFVSLDEALELLKPTSLLIITDTQSPRLVMFSELLEKAKRLSIIDHHRAGDDGYKDYLSYYVESSASSTVELVSEMFMFYNSNITMTAFEASIMLAGVIVDTNNFTMRSGTRTFEAAATLKSMGADMIFVRKLLQEPLESEKILAEALMNAEVYGEKFGIVCLNEDQTIPDRTTLAKISDKQLTIAGVEASFTIGKIDENTIGISARSLGDSINVQIIMEQMGGGGHFNSAASQINDSTLTKVKDQLKELLRLEYVEGGAEAMKVILVQDVKGKGKKDTIIEVANGYGNYLITNKLAVAATDENILAFEKQKEQEKIDAENRRKVLMKFRDEIDGKVITIPIKIGANGKVFGTITTKLICDEFESQTGIHLDKRKVELAADINSIGIFDASVKLDTGIVAQFTIKVEEKK